MPLVRALKWTVYAGDVAVLTQDTEFMDTFTGCLRLVALSWGWDLDNADYVSNPDRDQTWQNWPVRLYKMAYSARMFGLEDAFESLEAFALQLMEGGEQMSYGGHDLSWLFLGEPDPDQRPKR